MNNKAFGFTRLFIMLASSVVITCDPFQEDLIQKDKQFVFNPANQSVYYILPNSSAVINLNSIVQTTYTSLSLNISVKPERGDLRKLGDFILMYEPYGNFTEGYDRFIYSVTRNGISMKTDTIFIAIKQNQIEFQCGLYAVEDFASIKPGANVTISFLDNDRVCGVEKSNLYKSIFSKPQYGTATIADDVISYTANEGFEGWDQFVYRISTSDDNLRTTGDSVMTSFGLISILVNEVPCNFALHDDSITISVSSRATTAYEFDVLSNDVICSIMPFQSAIIQNPILGTAWSIEGGKIHYQKASAIEQNYSDSLVYRLCYKGTCKEAVARLAFNLNLYVPPGWSVQQLNLNGFFTSIFFIDENTGYVGGATGIFKTTDGGKIWSKLTLPSAIILPRTGKIFSSNLFELQFFDANHGFAAYGEDVINDNNSIGPAKGYLMETVDGGATWSLTQFEGAVTSVHFTSPTTGFVSTSSSSFAFYSSDDRVYKTMDGGESWSLMAYYGNCEDSGGLYNILFQSSTTGYARTFHTMMGTTDSGESWSCIVISSATLRLDFPGLTVKNNFVYVTFPKTDLPSEYSRIFRSENGEVWDLLGYCSSFNNSIEFSPSGDVGFIIGSSSMIGVSIPIVYISLDGGATWSKEASFDEYPTDSFGLYDIAVPSDWVAYAVRGDGLILKYTKNKI